MTVQDTVMKKHTNMTAATRRGLPWALGLLAFAAGCPAATDTTPDGGGGGDGGGGVTASFTSLYGDYFASCKNCHAPGAPGRTTDTEQTLNFTTRATALATLKTGRASGLIGNFTACNGVAFVAATPAKSLVFAVLDQPTRNLIDLSPAHPMCDADTISDMTVKVGRQPSSAFITALSTWITAGALDN
jgi:hypothetical protein